MFWLTPPREIPPKHRQPNAPCPKLAGNAYKALVDLPHDGSNPFTDGRDGKVDGTDERSAANVPQCTSAVETPAAASPQQTPNGEPLLRIWHRELITAAVNNVLYDGPMNYGPQNQFQYSAASLCAIEQAHNEIQWRLTTIDDNVYNSFDNLLQEMDAAWTENTALHKAYHASRKKRQLSRLLWTPSHGKLTNSSPFQLPLRRTFWPPPPPWRK
jgi:hypothetical protein